MLTASLVCLALNVYHEAKNQSFLGQVAVAQVVMNRVKDERYPNTVCEVVKQGQTYKWKPNLPIKNRCQFSWYCDGKSDRPKDKNAFSFAHAMAFKFYYGWLGKVEWVIDAMWYHADYVKPDWSYNKRHLATINNHIFYGVY